MLDWFQTKRAQTKGFLSIVNSDVGKGLTLYHYEPREGAISYISREGAIRHFEALLHFHRTSARQKQLSLRLE